MGNPHRPPNIGRSLRGCNFGVLTNPYFRPGRQASRKSIAIRLPDGRPRFSGARSNERHKSMTEAPIAPRNSASAPRPSAPVLSVIIPVLNEEKGLDKLLSRLLPVLKTAVATFEVIIIDDGSSDGTLALVKARNAADPRIKALSLSRNFGKEIAVAAGLRHAAGEAVIIMDSDLQHPPEVIPQLIEGWRGGYDIVYGKRTDRKADGPVRRLLARTFYRTFRTLSGTKLHDDAGDFRLLSRRTVAALNRLGERARFNKGLYAWVGFKTLGINFEVPDRDDKTPSRWRPRQLWHFALDGLLSFTTIPLRIWSYLGVVISMLALVAMLYILINTLIYGNPVRGYPTLIVSILFFGGVQLISLGVIGEYLGRVYEEVKARPLYIIGETVGIEPVEGNTRRAGDARPAGERPA
jgi:glycosyltransferase involved in cell wall biosynthesis